MWIEGAGWDVPPDAPTIPWAKWERMRWAALFEGAPAGPVASSLSDRAVSTARDGYGWRGIPGRVHLQLVKGDAA